MEREICPECKKSIDIGSKTCSECGFPIQSKKILKLVKKPLIIGSPTQQSKLADVKKILAKHPELKNRKINHKKLKLLSYTFFTTIVYCYIINQIYKPIYQVGTSYSYNKMNKEMREKLTFVESNMQLLHNMLNSFYFNSDYGYPKNLKELEDDAQEMRKCDKPYWTEVINPLSEFSVIDFSDYKKSNNNYKGVILYEPITKGSQVIDYNLYLTDHKGYLLINANKTTFTSSSKDANTLANTLGLTINKNTKKISEKEKIENKVRGWLGRHISVDAYTLCRYFSGKELLRQEKNLAGNSIEIKDIRYDLESIEKDVDEIKKARKNIIINDIKFSNTIKASLTVINKNNNSISEYFLENIDYDWYIYDILRKM